MAIPLASSLVEEVEVPGLEGAVIVQAFSVAEYRRMIVEAEDEAGEYDQDRFEIAVLVAGVKEPTLTREEAQALHEQHQMGPVRVVIEAIFRLAGLTRFGALSEEAVGEAEKSFRGQSD